MTRAVWLTGVAVAVGSAVGVGLYFGSGARWSQGLGLVLLAAAAATAVQLAVLARVRPMRLRERPPRLVTFRGRDWELGRLRRQFDDLRRPGESNGAIILPIHGMPGVGKSALARELARDLADEFPDGQLYANLGNAGNIRAEAEILSRFLAALRPGEAVPASTIERSARFRSFTASARVLVILDAARDQDQVARLIPTGKDCAVIVTSRRDLGPALGVRSFRLDVPDMDGALEMLRAVTNTAANDEKFAIEIIDRLGRLPLAIRAVGDAVVRDRIGLPQAARGLRELAAGMAEPERKETDDDGELSDDLQIVYERIESEYARLTADEQRAFELLSLVQTPSLVPWMLIPLLGLDSDRGDQAEIASIVSRLAERQLLDLAGLDQVSGLDRYRFHPLFRAFAQTRLRGSGVDTHWPMRRFDEVYQEAFRLAGEEPPEPGSLPYSHPLEEAPLPDRWVRAEYRNLLRCVLATDAAGRDEVCWRIAAQLGDAVPDEVDRRDVMAAFEVAGWNADTGHDPHALIRVQLARGRFLGRLGGYRQKGEEFPGLAEAFAVLDTAAAAANNDASRHSARLEAEAHRRIAEALLRAGYLRDADHELHRAALLARRVGDRDTERLIDLMRVAATYGLRSIGEPPIGDDDAELTFCYGWARAEVLRREGDWRAASTVLRGLLPKFEDDASRAAAILLRLAELRLDEFQADRRNRRHTGARAVHRAAEALYRFQHMHDHVGAVRARGVLVRALLACDRGGDALEQYQYATMDAEAVEPLLWHDRAPLWAGLRWAEGELLRRTGDGAGATRALVAAALVFHAHGDPAGEAGALASAGLSRLPADAFSGEPAGRAPVAWLERADDAPLRVGEPFTVGYSITAPALTQSLPPAGARRVTVMLDTDGADVTPRARSARLDAWAPLNEQVFTVVPVRPGPLRMRIALYDADQGALLQRTDLAQQDVVPSHDSVAA
ncbi:ATP-binding protein [Dactylosporangium sp. AC04546]|uniref:ATP-binding protein n=1 Tax=Dactylosporangium sp. AC04546 TaxID=2862460 RepID=UPI0027150EF3|nr:ATP-binding protein [Dactylosporangium sp. AC04546]WVK87597.1 ATP-binding protein [Dactylosporangium sp. AC04546]